MTEIELAQEIVAIARLATRQALAGQHLVIAALMQRRGHDSVNTRSFLERELRLPPPLMSWWPSAHSSSPIDMRRKRSGGVNEVGSTAYRRIWLIISSCSWPSQHLSSRSSLSSGSAPDEDDRQRHLHTRRVAASDSSPSLVTDAGAAGARMAHYDNRSRRDGCRAFDATPVRQRSRSVQIGLLPG